MSGRDTPIDSRYNPRPASSTSSSSSAATIPHDMRLSVKSNEGCRCTYVCFLHLQKVYANYNRLIAGQVRHPPILQRNLEYDGRAHRLVPGSAGRVVCTLRIDSFFFSPIARMMSKQTTSAPCGQEPPKKGAPQEDRTQDKRAHKAGVHRPHGAHQAGSKRGLPVRQQFH